MNKLPGYSLTGVGLLALFFITNYEGKAIPIKELWFVLSIFTIIVGAYILAKCKLLQLYNQRDAGNTSRSAEIDYLKRTGSKVRVTLDNAEVMTRSYQQEIIMESLPSRIEMLDALYDGNRNYKTEEIQQTYIVYYKQYYGKTYKFVSQASTQNADVLKGYIDCQKGIDLYIDLQNPKSYYFDLPF
ncbi:hypothetical protein QTN47_25180 [Danxiaibacter flavus]|uniref:Uncharacterized protein n=1 Tax=Danxiaibacter flavus TaxID=3049108 RepID=A0ABV3ZNW4_9BACT|nr:hypothetical protein QNM32_25185 [Chitinophagaceae bacterium DXS]